MPEWLLASIPVGFASVFAMLGALFLQLRDHHERLARVETKVDMILSGHQMVDYGPRP